jgi:hypothetical protein
MMMSFASLRVAKGRGVPVSAKPNLEPQKRAADKASRKIVASACRGGRDRKQDLIDGAGRARSDEIADLGYVVNEDNKGLRGRCRHRRQRLLAHGHPSCRTSIGMGDSREVEVVIFSQQADATRQAELPAATRAMLIATPFSRLREFSTRTKQAGDPVDRPIADPRSRRTRIPGAGGRARGPLLPRGRERCIAIGASPR